MFSYVKSFMGNSNSDDGDEETPSNTPAGSSKDQEGIPPILNGFDGFEFDDLSKTARGMYVDRKFTHNFQVRGPSYMEDQLKIHPGSAMCKLMLLELYEVEASKDGDRHDHIAIRGLAKARREAIAALPGNPFQIIINFQIPGDPPVSFLSCRAQL